MFKTRGSKGWRLQFSLAPIWQLGRPHSAATNGRGCSGGIGLAAATKVLLWLG